MSLDLVLTLARWSFFLSAMVLFGSVLFPFYAGGGSKRGDAWPPSVLLSFCCLVAAALWLATLARQLDASQPILAVIKLVLFSTSFGPSWIARLLLAAGALVCALARARVALVLTAAGLLVCEGWDGHAAALGAPAMALQSAHALFAGVWIGGLFPLARRTTASRADAVVSLRRFSTVGLAAVIGVVGTGVGNILAVAPVLSPGSSWTRLLALKLALFAAMVALAAVNRLWLTPRFYAGDRTASRRLFATILCEQILAAAVLLAAASLGQLDPYG